MKESLNSYALDDLLERYPKEYVEKMDKIITEYAKKNGVKSNIQNESTRVSSNLKQEFNNENVNINNNHSTYNLNNDLNNNSTGIVNQANNYTSTNSSKVTSNLEYVRSHMSNIADKTNNSIDYTSRRHAVDSKRDNNILYTKINEIMASYYAAQTKLMEKLNNELKFTEMMAEKYEELDKKMASKVGDL